MPCEQRLLLPLRSRPLLQRPAPSALDRGFAAPQQLWPQKNCPTRFCCGIPRPLRDFVARKRPAMNSNILLAEVFLGVPTKNICPTVCWCGVPRPLCEQPLERRAAPDAPSVRRERAALRCSSAARAGRSLRLPFGSSPPRLGLTEVVTLRAHARAALPQFLAACLLSSCLCATARSSPPCFPSLTKEIPLRAVPQAERWVLPPLRARAVATPPPSAVRARCGAGAVRARCGRGAAASSTGVERRGRARLVAQRAGEVRAGKDHAH